MTQSERPLWVFREDIKQHHSCAQGLMIKMSYKNARGGGNLSTPGVAVGWNSVDLIGGSFDWMGPLLMWWNHDGDIQEPRSVGFARRFPIGPNGSCTSVNRPDMYITLSDRPWCEAIFQSLCQNAPLASHPTTGESLFSLVVSKAQALVEHDPKQAKEALRLGEVFIQMQAQTPQSCLSTFFQLCEAFERAQNPVLLHAQTQSFIKRGLLQQIASHVSTEEGSDIYVQAPRRQPKI